MMNFLVHGIYVSTFSGATSSAIIGPILCRYPGNLNQDKGEVLCVFGK